MDKRPIGVFDSGLGGLTAVRELMRILPGEDIIYFGDTGRVPYGGRSRETIMKYAREDIAFLRSFDIKYVLAACGTVSTNGLGEIKAENNIPVRGVAGAAVRAAVRATRNNRIALIGTAASIRSGTYDRKILELRPDCELYKKACPLFVPLVENGRIEKDDQVLRLVAEEYLAPLRDAGCDTMILGCTHYPIIADTIRDIMGEGVALIDAGAAAAREMAEDLAETGSINTEGGEHRYFVSDSADGFRETAEMFLGSGLKGEVRRISISGE